MYSHLAHKHEKETLDNIRYQLHSGEGVSKPSPCSTHPLPMWGDITHASDTSDDAHIIPLHFDRFHSYASEQTTLRGVNF